MTVYVANAGPLTSSALPNSDPSFSDKKIAASAIASLYFQKMLKLKNADSIKEFIYANFAGDVVLFDASSLALTAPLMQEIAGHFPNIISFYAKGATLDAKPVAAFDLARFFPKIIDIRIDTAPHNPKLHQFDSHIMRLFEDRFGVSAISEKRAWGHQFPALLEFLEALKTHLTSSITAVAQTAIANTTTPPAPFDKAAVIARRVAKKATDKQAKRDTEKALALAKQAKDSAKAEKKVKKAAAKDAEAAKTEEKDSETALTDDLQKLTIKAAAKTAPAAYTPPHIPGLLDLRKRVVDDTTFAEELREILKKSEPKVTVLRLPSCILHNVLIDTLSACSTLRELDMSLCRWVDYRFLPKLKQITKIIRTIGGENNDLWVPISQMEATGTYIRKHLLPQTQIRVCTFGKLSMLALGLLSALDYLDLEKDDEIDDDACKTALSKLTKLKSLYIHKSDITKEGIKSLAPLVALERLTLMSSPKIDNEAFNALTAQFKELRELAIGDAGITDQAFDYFARLKNLRCLLLGISKDVTVQGYKRLVQLKATLERLTITHPTIDEGLVLHLITHLDKLKFLRLTTQNDQKVSETIQKMCAEKGIELEIFPTRNISLKRLPKK